MRKPIGSVTTSGGSATCENFSNIIPNGDFATECAKFWKKFALRRGIVRNSRSEIHESIHNSQSNKITIQVLNTLRPHLPLAARRDRQLRMREASPQSSRRKRDRSHTPQRRSRPGAQKSRQAPPRPSTRTLPAGVPYKCAPIPELYLATPRRHRSLC